MKLIFSLLIIFVHISCAKIGYGINVENSPKLHGDEIKSDFSLKDSLREFPSPGVNISPEGNTGNVTDTALLSALASVIPKIVGSGDADANQNQQDKEAAKLSYFEPKVLYTTIPVILVCMVAIGLLAEYFGEGIETGR
ncbi:hypothetical protein FG386_002183 [Cryptosporidium ryanae]|uniref:uncharacterized protein n=1 Tax=Cryptosporidium ryanae TaxID=515981 RepID=UPI003519FCE5|nr:hypothetical protein FG386_002183 [Cryptosporidium ryanae]